MNGAFSFGLLSALVWGAGDFAGGLATRRANAYTVVLVTDIFGALLLGGAALLLRQPLPVASDWWWSAAAGLAGALGMIALYTALGSGHMGVVAPLSAVLTALVPIAIGAMIEGLPSLVQMVGFVCALAAVWLLAGSGDHTLARRDLVLALVAGLSFGFFFFFIDRTGPQGGLWNLTFARLCASLLMLALVLAMRHPLLPPRSVLPVNLANGALDAGGNLFFMLAAQAGRLDVASVLACLYPGVTALLAWLVLGERLNRPQTAGVAAALVAIILIVI